MFRRISAISNSVNVSVLAFVNVEEEPFRRSFRNLEEQLFFFLSLSLFAKQRLTYLCFSLVCLFVFFYYFRTYYRTYWRRGFFLKMVKRRICTAWFTYVILAVRGRTASRSTRSVQRNLGRSGWSREIEARGTSPGRRRRASSGKFRVPISPSPETPLLQVPCYSAVSLINGVNEAACVYYRLKIFENSLILDNTFNRKVTNIR